MVRWDRGVALALGMVLGTVLCTGCDLECSLIEPNLGISVAVELPSGLTEDLDFELVLEPIGGGGATTYTFRCTAGSCSSAESAAGAAVSVDFDQNGGGQPDRLRMLLPDLEIQTISLTYRVAGEVAAESSSPVAYEPNQPNGPQCDADDYPLAFVVFNVE